MNGIEMVKKVMQEEGVTSPKLAAKLGYNTPSGVTERLRGKQDMRVDTFVRFLSAMGYEVVVRKSGEPDGVVLGKETDTPTPVQQDADDSEKTD